MRCEADTASGERCQNKAKDGERLCSVHLGTAGRRSMIEDEELVSSLVELVNAGVYQSVACGAVGIGESTFYSWKERGEADREADQATPYRAFLEAIERAEREAEARMVLIVRRAASGVPAQFDDEGNMIRAEVRPDWKAAMTFLERKYPERWSRREVHEVGGVGGGPVTLVDLERALAEAPEEQP